MSDSLKNRLESHSNSFDGLLSLIPAKFYYEDEAQSQWKKRSLPASEKKAEHERLKKAKFDPEQGASALDEIRRRQSSTDLANEEARRDSSVGIDETIAANSDSEEDVIIYDDNGNAINAQPQESVRDILRAKREGAGSSTNPADSKASEPANVKQNKKTKLKQQKKSVSGSDSVQPGTQIESEDSKDSKDSKEPKEPKEPKESTESEKPENSEEIAEEDDAERQARIEELRKKVSERIAELKRQRKAPGSGVEGAPKNREMLLAARKRRLEMKKAKKRAENAEAKETTATEVDADEETESVEPNEIKADLDDVMFGKVEFTDGSVLSKDLTSIEQQRKVKKRNAFDQLRVLEKRKEKIADLDKDKQDEIAENSKWSRAILQSEGAKIRDDEKMLRRTIKQNTNRKRRSEKEWRERIENVKTGISSREAKRNANIRAHKEAKKLHLKGKKRKMHMKRAAASLNGK